MENKDKKYTFFGKIISFNKNERYVEATILHYGVANENGWTPMPGCFDDFFERLIKNKKGIPAYYNHNDGEVIIGKWDLSTFVVNGSALTGRMYLSDIPFVNETVIPQIEDGTLQGASPSGAPVKSSYNNQKQSLEVLVGIIEEISLVGIPADLKADIIELKASIQAQELIEQNENFEIDLLTI